MAQGLNLADVVNVNVVIGPLAPANRSFGTLCIIGSSNVIDVVERLRYYTTLSGVLADFGTTAPEALAAQLYFGQSPTPTLLAIGRWAQAPTPAILHGGGLSVTQQLMSNFNSITNGGFSVVISGSATPANVTGLNLTTLTNLSQVAAAIQAASAGALFVSWDGVRFNLTTVQIPGTISYASAPTTIGTDISGLLQLQVGQALVPVPGQALETPLQAAQLLANLRSDWYAFMFAASLPDVDNLALAAFAEGSSPTRMYGFTTNKTAELTSPNTATVGYQLAQLNFAHTVWVYSSSNPYAVAGLFGRALTVDFTGNNTTLTLKFKQIIGLAPENLSETQAIALGVNHGNVFVAYANGASIIQQGTTAGGRFFDEVHGLDWLSNYVQAGQFNLLYTSTTKVPQTDAGITRMLTQLESDLAQAVTNGLVAPGVWNASGFGQLGSGMTLSKGFYVYAPPIATQSQADRDARKSPTMQAAVKLAGAVHSANIILNINR